MTDNQFRTLKGYKLHNSNQLTDSMEDYLEMICRTSEKEGYVRMSQLAEALNVKPSSCTKMVANLRDAGYVDYQKYGLIKPTVKGKEMGEYLLHRHQVLTNFLSYVNQTDEELEEVEQIEHYLKKETVANIEKLLNKLEKLEQKPGIDNL